MTRSWPRRFLIGMNVVTALCLVVTLAGFGYVRWRYGQITKIDVSDVLHLGGTSDPGQPMNVLLVGSDSRAGLSTSDEAQFGTTAQSGAVHTDTIMVLRIDPKSQQAAILSLPRDLWVPIADTNGSQRINTAAQGPKGVGDLIQTIHSDFGIDIDHFAQVDFVGFRSIVNTVGGVTIPFPAPARDLVSDLRIPTAGCVKLNGDQALAYARSRHYEQLEHGRWVSDGLADFGRIQRQQVFIRRVLQRSISVGARNPIKLNSLIGSGIKYLTVDRTLTPGVMLKLAKRFRSLDPNSIQMMSLDSDVRFVTIKGQDVLLPVASAVQSTVAEFLTVGAPAAPSPTPSPSTTVTAPHATTTTTLPAPAC